jgi:hypothetical protein
MGWSGLTNYDVAWVTRRLPRLVVELLQASPRQLILAGGFIRSCIANEEVHDIDLFTTSEELAKKLAIQLAGGDRIFKTDNAISVRLPGFPLVQFIHRWTFSEPELVAPSFDFTVARAALWWVKPAEGQAGWRSMCDERFYPDLAAHRLVYCSPDRNEDAGGSILRVLKFYQRGYRIPLDSLGSVIARLQTGVDSEKLSGSQVANGFTYEQALSRILTGLLREVDPSIDPERIAHLPAVNS